MQMRQGMSPARQQVVSDRMWAVVLAGGEGVRLRPLIRQIYDQDVPKQYAVLTGGRSLLEQTLERLRPLIPPERTVVVTMASHLRYLTRELRYAEGGPHVIAQPQDRGTAAGILLAAHWIQARDRGAPMTIFPADHFVRDESTFLRFIGIMGGFVEKHPEWLVAMGVSPTGAEPEFGWIQPGERLPAAGYAPIFRARCFVEKPSPEMAAGLWAAGGLWSTFIVSGSTWAFIEAGRECIPRLDERLARAVAFAGAEHEHWALGQAFALAPSANFSRSVLQMTTKPLAVAEVPDIGWHDLGTPARVLRMMRQLGVTPSWAEALNPAS